jgi:methionyl-tRNA synthetase
MPDQLSGVWADGPLFSKFWPSVEHIIAKDILKPHGIYWPIMLQAAGIAPYRHLNVHGYWNLDHSKISKSLGNVIRPQQLKDASGLMLFAISFCGKWFLVWMPSSVKKA